MKTEIWKPHGMTINGEKMYIAARRKDISKPLHGGNVEQCGEYISDRDAVQMQCDRLNAETYTGQQEVTT